MIGIPSYVGTRGNMRTVTTMGIVGSVSFPRTLSPTMSLCPPPPPLSTSCWDKYPTLSQYIGYIRISINISYICHVWDRMTSTIDKEALLRIPITKRGRKKKKWINRGWADTIPGFVLSRNISYIPIWYDVWYHTRYNDAGDEQRGMGMPRGYPDNIPGFPGG